MVLAFYMVLKINNRDARRLWLRGHGLASAPTGTVDALQIIKDLGFVQIDSIRNVTRAHHHILWSRNQNYREPMLDKLLSDERSVFEHFTHDASIIPMEFYPMWKKQFLRMRERRSAPNYYRSPSSLKIQAEIKARIHDQGALSTKAFSSKIAGEKKMWSRPPHKLALDHLWYIGELSTAHRINFHKYYDLSERVIPAKLFAAAPPSCEQIHWLCSSALERLTMASLRDIQAFWDALSMVEVKAWAGAEETALVPIEMQAADGTWHELYAPRDIKQRLENIKAPTSRLRILNPFDPAIRDRARLKRIFGFEYKIEIFVPAAKRKWGYYVYPLLEGARFVGRIELKADRKAGTLSVINLWAEEPMEWTEGRSKKLSAELARLARLIGVRDVIWDGRLPPSF